MSKLCTSLRPRKAARATSSVADDLAIVAVVQQVKSELALRDQRMSEALALVSTRTAELSSALALEDPAPQYRIILAARDDVAKSDLVAKLVTGYKSNEYRRFVETDPKAKGFSRPEYWR